MAAVSLNGAPPCSLDLPVGAVSLQQALHHLKNQLGAEWVRGCPAFGNSVKKLKGSSLSFVARDESGKQRVVLSARGWQPGGGLAADASLLGFEVEFSDLLPYEEADDLPASLLRRGFWSVQAFTADGMQVSLILGDSQTVPLAITHATTYGDVRAHAACLLGEPAERLRLWKRGSSRPLDAWDQQAVPGTSLRVHVAAPHAGAKQAWVKSLTGKSLSFMLSPNSTAYDLKMQIADREGMRIEQQRLIYAGMGLEDGRTLASYGVEEGSTLHLVLRLRGGMFEFSSGRDGGFGLLDAPEDADDDAAAVRSIAGQGLAPVEVLLPDGSTELLGCKPDGTADDVLAALRERLAQRSLLHVDVDAVEDVQELRALLRQAQGALRQR